MEKNQVEWKKNYSNKFMTKVFAQEFICFKLKWNLSKYLRKSSLVELALEFVWFEFHNSCAMPIAFCLLFSCVHSSLRASFIHSCRVSRMNTQLSILTESTHI